MCDSGPRDSGGIQEYGFPNILAFAGETLHPGVPLTPAFRSEAEEWVGCNVPMFPNNCSDRLKGCIYVLSNGDQKDDPLRIETSF